MKNLFKFMGIALVACSMLVSCGKTFTINATPNDEAFGTVTGGGEYDKDAECVLTATPATGFTFVKWSDGVTENPRTIVVTEDLDLVAIFNGVSVKFDGQSWGANPSTSQYTYYAQGSINYTIEAKKGTATEYPQANAYFSCASGSTVSGDYDADELALNNNAIDNVEYYASRTVVDNNGYNWGDWWAKSCGISVSAFDAATLDLATKVDATMFDAYAVYVDETATVETAATKAMGINAVTNLRAAKAAFVPKKRNF